MHHNPENQKPHKNLLWLVIMHSSLMAHCDFPEASDLEWHEPNLDRQIFPMQGFSCQKHALSKALFSSFTVNAIQSVALQKSSIKPSNPAWC